MTECGYDQTILGLSPYLSGDQILNFKNMFLMMMEQYLKMKQYLQTKFFLPSKRKDTTLIYLLA